MSLPLQYIALLALQILLGVAMITYVSDVLESDQQALSHSSEQIVVTARSMESLRERFGEFGAQLDRFTQDFTPGARLDAGPLRQQLRELRTSLATAVDLEELRNRHPGAIHDLSEMLNGFDARLIEDTVRVSSADARRTVEIRNDLHRQFRQIQTDGLGMLAGAAIREMQAITAASTQKTATNQGLLNVIMIGFVVLQALLMMFALWLFNHQVGGLARIAERLTKGDRRANLPQQNRRDHIGQLARAISHFRGTLNSLSASREQLHTMLKKHDEEARERSKAEFALKMADSAFENVGDGIVITDIDGKVLRANQGIARLLARTPEQVQAEDPLDMMLPEEHKLKSAIRMALVRNGSWQGEVEFTNKAGQSFITLLSAHYVKTASSKDEHIVYIVNDVTTSRQNERKLIHIAERDRVSGLLNRDALFHRGQALIDEPGTEAVGLLIIGLDGFKAVNEALGPYKGDQILRHVAVQLTAMTPDDAIVARLGGDEFAMLCPGENAPAAKLFLQKQGQKILAELTKTTRIDGYSINLHCSGGVAGYPEDGDNIGELLKAADTAMHHAKELGGDRIMVHAGHLKEIVQRRFELKQALENALRGREVKLWYQPLVSLASGKLVGFEALMRWRRANGEWVSPGEFIPLAEESGFIVPLTEWAFNQACGRLREWSRQMGSPLTMAVNIPPNLLLRENMERQLASVVKKHGLSPGSLILEVTESGLTDSNGLLAEKLEQLAMLGFNLAIDDFGTGHSSLGRLARLPISKIKIDREFVTPVEQEEESRRLLGSILSMAHELEFEVVVEGVENENQINILRDYDARITVQGYYFDKPQPDDYWDGVFMTGAPAPYKLPDRPPANKRRANLSVV